MKTVAKTIEALGVNELVAAVPGRKIVVYRLILSNLEDANEVIISLRSADTPLLGPIQLWAGAQAGLVDPAGRFCTETVVSEALNAVLNIAAKVGVTVHYELEGDDIIG